MTTESLPSKSITLLDAPEVENFELSFQYNYWTADEFENGLGSSQAALTQIPSETFDASYVDRSRRLPRLIRLQWKPVTLNRIATDSTSPVSIQKNLEKLHSEETFTNNDYTSFRYQDSGADTKLKFFLDKFTGLLTDQELQQAKSPIELVELVNNKTNDQVTSQFIGELVARMSQKGMFFSNASSLANAVLERIKNVILVARLSNRILVPVTTTIQEDSLGIFSDEFSETSFLADIQQTQDNAIANRNSNLMSPLDYEFEILSYVDYVPQDTHNQDPRVESVGYIIEKREVKSNGSVQTYPPIVLENPFTGVTYDGQIRYNSIYYYKIRSVFLVEIAATEKDTNQNLLVRFLVGSQFSEEKAVQTVEMIAPPPPADFNVNWDYGQRCARITWNLPVNPQQDIKFIQLFRRGSIQEPFQLIKMWDFNDTNTKVTLNEFPLAELVQTVPSFVGIYFDREFTKESKYIYAVASVDAHGLTSNYSLQFEVSFDKFANKMIKKLLSMSGAPKQYPNAFLNSDTFVDTLKDSGHSALQVVFNPEYTSLINGLGADMNLLKTDKQKGTYRIQMINIDMQSQQNVEIVLKDKRTTASMTNPTTDGGINPGSLNPTHGQSS